MQLAYDGGVYAGWQRQVNAVTVQQRLEEALADLVGEKILLTGAGRTDAGVHARGQVAHFDLHRDFTLSGLVHGANHRLPADIRILAAAKAAPGFHARFSAVAKEYSYRLVRGRAVDPREATRAVSVPAAIDFARLAAATLHLPGTHDFSAFALAGGAHRSSLRTIFHAGWEDEAPFLVLRLVGDGFLRGMVRGLVGTLLEVGLGRRSIAELAMLLAGAPRSAAGPTAPAQGLTLERVDYGSERTAMVTCGE